MVDRAQEFCRVLPDVAQEGLGPFRDIDVGERDDRASNGVIQRLVGHDAKRVPALIPAEHLIIRGNQGLDHAGDLGRHLDPAEPVQERDRPPQIGRHQIQQALGGRGVAPDPKIHAHDDDGVVDPGQHVVEVVVGLTQLRHSILQLLVHRRELFVGGLHLLA